MFFDILFLILVFIIFFGEFLYPKITLFFPKKSINKSKIIPRLTILIPVLNEEKVIADKIKNTFSLDYPKDRIEVVVISNGSTDKTCSVASQFPVTLLKSKKGKIHALNKGLEYSKTEVVVITDADVMLDKKSLKSAVAYLTDGVGAVNGFVVARGKAGDRLMKEKENYKKKDWNLRYNESMVGSVCNLDGKFLLFKKSIFNKFPKNSLVDDYTITFSIIEKGYRLFVDKSAKVYEKLEENLKEEMRQFKRYGTSVLIINFRNLKFLFNPKYGYFGLMTFPFRRFFPVLYPIFLLYIALYLVITWVFWLPVFMVGTILLFFYKRLVFIQILAVFGSYFAVFNKNDLKLGEWESTLRKNGSTK